MEESLIKRKKEKIMSKKEEDVINNEEDVINKKEDVINNENGLKTKLQQNPIRLGIFALAVLIVFLLGLVPMWWSQENCEAQAEKTKVNLRKAEIHNILAVSVIETRRGEYEAARLAASNFYTQLRVEDGKGDSGILSSDQRAKIKGIFENRDRIITMLAQRDQASNDQLNELYNGFLQIVPLKIEGSEVSIKVTGQP